MAPTVHVIDPDADTVIILRNACTSFATWIEPDAETTDQDTAAGTAGKDGGASSATPPARNWAKALRTKRTLELSPRDIRVGDATMKKRKAKGSTSLGGPSQTFPPFESTPGAAKEPEVHYNVSQRHLQLASPWFKRAMAKKGWAESKLLDGRYRILAHDWDEQAFLIVLNIIHLRHKNVPRSVSLEMLAKIGMLVDYYECGEALELFTAMWIEGFDKTVSPAIYCRDLILWIWVAWIFNSPERFTDATSVVIRESREVMQTLDLPIPPSVSSEIDLRRYRAIEAVIDGLHNLLHDYRGSEYRCKSNSELSFPCSSILLGALTKELDNWSLINPRPEVPFSDLSFSSICAKARDAKSPVWTSVDNIGGHYNGLTSAVRDVIDRVCDGVIGLSLSQMRGTPGPRTRPPSKRPTTKRPNSPLDSVPLRTSSGLEQRSGIDKNMPGGYWRQRWT